MIILVCGLPLEDDCQVRRVNPVISKRAENAVFAVCRAWFEDVVPELRHRCDADYHKLRIFGDERSDPRPLGDALDVARHVDVEDDDGQVVFHAESHGRQVHDF